MARPKAEIPILYLPMKRKWYDMVLTGEKKEEYRLMSPHWMSRVGRMLLSTGEDGSVECDVRRPFRICFVNGYGSAAPRFFANVSRFELRRSAYHPEWGEAEYDGKPHFAFFIDGIEAGKENAKWTYSTYSATGAWTRRPTLRRHPEGVNPVYFTSSDFIDMDGEGVQWYDKAKGGYVSFPSYAEKLRYGLRCFKVPDEIADGLVAKCQGRKWSNADIQSVAMAYYSLGKSPEEIVSKFLKK